MDCAPLRGKLAYPRLSHENLSQLQGNGFTTLYVLSSKEVFSAIGIIANHLRSRFSLSYLPNIVDPDFAEGSIGNLIRKNKESRVLSEYFYAEFMNLGGIRDLVDSFNGFGLAKVSYGDLVTEDRSEVYFRLVRPKSFTDVGGFHRDHWFNEIYTPDIANLSNFKVWIALNCPPDGGLEFILPTADLNYNYNIVNTPQGPRPVGDFDERSLSFFRPVIYPGEAFLFDPFILHRGAVNPGPTNRVSVELAFFSKL